MKFRARISAKTRSEQLAIERAMADAEVRAFVIMMGNLFQLDSDRARLRVLRFVGDKVDEEKAHVIFQH